MKLTRNQMIALGIALIFIIIGLGQAVTGIEINKKIMDQVSFVLLIIAAFAIFSGRKKKMEETPETKKDEEVKEQDMIEEKDNGEENDKDK